MYTCNALSEGPENDEENARRCPLDLAPDRPSGSGLQITHSTRCFEMTFKESSLSRDFVSASENPGGFSSQSERWAVVNRHTALDFLC